MRVVCPAITSDRERLGLGANGFVTWPRVIPSPAAITVMLARVDHAKAVVNRFCAVVRVVAWSLPPQVSGRPLLPLFCLGAIRRPKLSQEFAAVLCSSRVCTRTAALSPKGVDHSDVGCIAGFWPPSSTANVFSNELVLTRDWWERMASSSIIMSTNSAQMFGTASTPHRAPEK